MKNQKFSNLELSCFCDQLAMILSAGISSAEGLSIMQEDSKDAEEKRILSQILKAQEEGSSLESAFRETGLFPSYLLQMVKIGEETGKTDEVFSSLAKHYRREDEISTSIRQALLYPCIMIGMMLAVILLLLTKVLPIFRQVYAQLGTEMTGVAGSLLSFGNLLSRHAFLFFLILILCLVFALISLKKHQGRHFLGKEFYEKTAACHFSGAMALALSSGLNPEHALELVCDLNEDSRFAGKLAKCKTLMEEGTSLSKAFSASGIFSGLYARMASIGEKTGTMEQSMEQIASSYQEEIDAKLEQILSIIEPTLVIALSLIVGVILLSVMLPLMGILSGL